MSMSVLRHYDLLEGLSGLSGDRRAIKLVSLDFGKIPTKRDRCFNEHDLDLLKQTLSETIGLDQGKDFLRIRQKKRLEVEDITPAIQKLTRSNELEKYNGLIMLISSYGQDGHILGSDTEKIAINDIIEEFRGSHCLPLVGKPKWFIVQACRDGLYEEHDPDVECDAGSIPFEVNKVTYIPSEADILTTISEIPGNVPWRKQTGACSPFMEALCDQLRQNVASLDAVKVFQRASQVVYEELLRHNQAAFFESKELIPYFTSTLTAQLSFKVLNESLPRKG